MKSRAGPSAGKRLLAGFVKEALHVVGGKAEAVEQQAALGGVDAAFVHVAEDLGKDDLEVLGGVDMGEGAGTGEVEGDIVEAAEAAEVECRLAAGASVGKDVVAAWRLISFLVIVVHVTYTVPTPELWNQEVAQGRPGYPKSLAELSQESQEQLQFRVSVSASWEFAPFRRSLHLFVVEEMHRCFRFASA